MEQVSELMTRSPQLVRADAPLVVAAHVMVRLAIRHLPVVDDAGAIVGMVTDFAVFSRGGLVGPHDELWVTFEASDAALTCGDLATPVTTASEDDGLSAVLRRLAESKDDVVVVIDDQRHPVGIVTEHDAVRLAVGVLPTHVSGQEETRPVRSVREDSAAAQAFELMRAHRIRHLLVVDADGRLTGVVSWGDVVADQAMIRKDLTAGDIVRRGRLIAETDALSLRRAAELMARHKVGCVPILDGQGRPRAIVTRTDVLRGLVAALEREALFPES